MSLVHDRVEAVAEAARRIKAVGLDPFDNPAGKVAEASAALAALAARADLFPLHHYPSKTEGDSGFSSFYRLAEDADYRNAIYISVCPGSFLNNHPHNHLHWTLIAGVRGTEHNGIYRRADDESVPLQGKLRKIEDVAIKPGQVHHLTPQDYHTVEYDGTEPAVNIHAYGTGLDHPVASQRPGFLSPDSDVYRLGRPGPRKPWGVQAITPQEIAAALGDGRPIATFGVELGDAVPGGLFDLLIADRNRPHVPDGLDPLTPILLVGDADAAELAAELLARQGYAHFVRATPADFRLAA